ncbi:MAG: hypothetical protein PWP28_402 [Oceanotoga sp.]|uniref:ATP-binding protein n=1 Tax=Oceanotoga sp. TaxID=2108366 RepID=UPI00264F0383|nr:ATP-binding protein [Oceanotoga sp.]MDN5341527.1 hypothetical protein [Oceanotoga sp.]
MGIFDYESEYAIGTVNSVDTSTVVISVEDDSKLKQLQVNHLLVIRSSKTSQHLIAIVSKILRKSMIEQISDEEQQVVVENIIKATLIGTHVDKVGTKDNVFKRTLESVPEINAECFVLNGEKLTRFMQAISNQAASSATPLSLGKYILDEEAEAWLDGNKFFQRHAVVVGSTGSGKSWSVARLLEQVSELKAANALVFDIHGEYGSMNTEGFHHYKVAGPNDQPDDKTIYLPYWLLTYEEMLSMLLDRSDNNAPNQAMMFSNTVLKYKEELLSSKGLIEEYSSFTLDSPIPYNLTKAINDLISIDKEMVPGANNKYKQGPYFGKLTRFIQRLSSKVSDRRLNFLFNQNESLLEMNYLDDLIEKLIGCKSSVKKGVKIVDFSEVPSDILPLIIGLVTRIIFSIQQWTEKEKRHPIALFCDEAHLYIPSDSTSNIDATANQTFERIAKEGRKYGVGLVVISQRPSEVNRTVLSQCNNFVALRLTNIEDQNVVKRLLPDSLGNFAELLPILDIGEALVVGDSSLLPSRIKIQKPALKPTSGTIDFWDEWAKDNIETNVPKAVKALRKQSKM